MEAPKCKLCGERHWGGCQKLKPTTNPAIFTSDEPLSRFSVSARISEDKVEVVATPKFDRTAYQREYMRKRRAKAKSP